MDNENSFGGMVFGFIICVVAVVMVICMAGMGWRLFKYFGGVV
jgi:hypothetical protein